MGTLLQERGLKPGETPEDWNVERPEDIAAIHRAYVKAGAEVIYANTFGANRLKYHGRHELEEVIRCGLSIAHRVKGLEGLGGCDPDRFRKGRHGIIETQISSRLQQSTSRPEIQGNLNPPLSTFQTSQTFQTFHPVRN